MKSPQAEASPLYGKVNIEKTPEGHLDVELTWTAHNLIGSLFV
jgi:hypothetical protein